MRKVKTRRNVNRFKMTKAPPGAFAFFGLITRWAEGFSEACGVRRASLIRRTAA